MASRGGPTGSPGPSTSPATRYAYLVGRLRNRQITMEEAIELFGILDETIRMLRTAAVRAPPPPPSGPAAGAAPTARSPAAGAVGGLATDDLLTAGILMIGAGAGISAALRRRAAEGPKDTGAASSASEKRSSLGP